VISTDHIMLCIAEMQRQRKEDAEEKAALEARVKTLEERIDAHGIYIEKRCLIEALEKIDE